MDANKVLKAVERLRQALRADLDAEAGHSG
jgi:hypothetical protein